MKALVTGGAGFIGSHVVEALCARGDNVTVLDNLSTGSRDNLAWKRPEHWLRFVEADVQDERVLRDLLPGCDCVFHLAGVNSVPRAYDNLRSTNAANVDGTLSLLLGARDVKVGRIILASSSSIYGNVAAPAKHEGLAPQPESFYALQKYAAEQYALLAHRLLGVPTVVLRLFNVFGPRQLRHSPYSAVIARFCDAYLRGEPPVLHGDGSQSRDFTYVTNVVHAFLLAAAAPPERVVGKVFNAACNQSISLQQILDELSRLTGKTLDPHFASARPGDVHTSMAAISAAQEAFGYAPTVTWQEGLKLTLDSFATTAPK